MPASSVPGQNLTVSTSRLPSPSIWSAGNGVPWLNSLEDPSAGTPFFDDFTDFPSAGIGTNGEKQAGAWNIWVGNQASAVVGTAADTTNLPLEGGVIGLTDGSNNNISITMAAPVSTYRLISPASGFPLQKKVVFECCIGVSSVASGAFDLFVGLMDTGDGGTRITSAADLVFSSANTIKTAAGNGGCIGFWKRATTNPSDVGFVYNVNNGTAQNPGSSTWQKLASTYGQASALVALTTTNGNVDKVTMFRKFGFVYDPDAYAARIGTTLNSQTAGNLSRGLVRVYVDGLDTGLFLTPADVQASTFPSTYMAPVIGFRTGASGAGIAYVDWVRCWQGASR